MDPENIWYKMIPDNIWYKMIPEISLSSDLMMESTRKMQVNYGDGIA